MSTAPRVRTAVADDVPQIARLHVETWRETYRGLMSDQILDDPGFLSRRELFWAAAITDPLYARNRIAVAERAGDLVGIAMAGPPADADAPWPSQLYVLYTYASVYGLGAGAVLLDTVVTPATAACLWVADPNPRAQAFYGKQGFVPDGTVQVTDGVREMRMVRTGR